VSIRIDQIKDPRTRQRLLDAMAETDALVRSLRNESLGTGGGESRHEAVSVANIPGESASEAKAGAATQPARSLLSTDEANLNKTEQAFLLYLRHVACEKCIGVMNVTLKLADDCRYTPDFVTYGGTYVHFWEVKGYWRDDARVKIKVAARLFPWAKFTAVQRIKGEWRFEEIKP
jgi:hypothetical protein